MKLPLLTDAPPLRGTRVFLRVDLNLPIKNGKISDDFRLKRTLPTISYLREKGARITLVSHRSDTESLLSVAKYLGQFEAVSFVHDFKELGDSQKKSEPGSIILLENIRTFGGEEENSESFSRQLSHFGDIYVNEAFSASHRAHASIVGVPKYLESFAGFLFAEEVTTLSKAFKPARPAVFILGGAKVSTKLPLIEKFLKLYDTVFVGGAMANDCFAAAGLRLGKSLVSSDIPDLSKVLKHPNLLLPQDVVVTGPHGIATKAPSAVESDERIVDAGAKTTSFLRSLVGKAKFVLWNGPLGIYEAGFKSGSEALARGIAETKSFSIVGGGDTGDLIHGMQLEKSFGFLSTGGGAMLDFLAAETLPGIEALLKH